MENKILILVRGGIVQAIHTSKDANIVIVDYDEIDKEKQFEANVLKQDSIQDKFYPLFDGSSELGIRKGLRKINF